MRNQNDGSWLHDTPAILKPKPLPPPPMNFQRPPPSWRLPRSPLLPTYPPPRYPPPLTYPSNICGEGLLPTPCLADLSQSPNTWPLPAECPWAQNRRIKSSDYPNISEMFSAENSSLPPSPTFRNSALDHPHLLSQEMNGLYAPRSAFSRPNVDVPDDFKKPLSVNKSQPRPILAPQIPVARAVTPVSESTLDPNCRPFAPARQSLAPSNDDPPPPGTEELTTAYTPSTDEFPPLSEPSASTPDWMSRTASEHDQLPNPSLSFLDDSEELEDLTIKPAMGSVDQFLPRNLRPPLLPTPSNFPPFGPRNVKNAVSTVGSEGTAAVRSEVNENGLCASKESRFSADQITPDSRENFDLRDPLKPSGYFGTHNDTRFSSNDTQLPSSRICGPTNDLQIPTRPANMARSSSDFPARPDGLLKSAYGQFSVLGSATNPSSLFKLSSTKDDINTCGFSLPGPQGPGSPVDPAEDGEMLDPRNLLSSAPLIEDFPVPDEYRVSKFLGEKLPKINIRQERTELLFFTFYSSLGDALQLVAASLLFERGWRYHKQDCIWLARWPGVRPEEKTSQYEKGLYQYFDVATWRRIPGCTRGTRGVVQAGVQSTRRQDSGPRGPEDCVQSLQRHFRQRRHGR